MSLESPGMGGAVGRHYHELTLSVSGWVRGSPPLILKRDEGAGIRAAELDMTSRCQHIIEPLEAALSLCFIAANRL